MINNTFQVHEHLLAWYTLARNNGTRNSDQRGWAQMLMHKM